MGEKFVLSKKCTKFHIAENDSEKVLRELTGLLEMQGYVDTDYAEKVCEREKNYPTGLQFEHIAIALPHGESMYVRQSAIAIGKCDQKLYFGKMEDPDTRIPVDLVVLLAVKDPETHLTVLGNLIEMFSVKETCEQIMAADEAHICEIFENNLYTNREIL